MLNRINFKSSLLRNTIILMSGTILAQAITISISPILTRIYSPEMFGVFAMFMSITLLLSTFATAKYDFAIILPKKEEDGFSLVILSLLFNLIFCLFLFIFIYIFIYNIDFFETGVNGYEWIYFLPFSVFLFSLYEILISFENRRKNYKKIAFSKVIQSSVTAFIQLSISLISIGFIGLILGRVIGVFSAIYSLAKVVSILNIKKQLDIDNIKHQAKKYIKFPKFTLPSEILSVLTSELPIFLFFILYGDTEVGLYALALRVMSTPLGIIGSSLTTVFRQTASEIFNKHGNCKELFIKTFKTLLVVSIIPFFILAVYSPEIFSFVFGEEWEKAGSYVQIMSIMFFFQFIESPLSYLYYIAGKQKEDMYLNMYILFSSFTALMLGYYFFNDIYYSILFYSLNWSIVYIFAGFRSYEFALGVEYENR